MVVHCCIVKFTSFQHNERWCYEYLFVCVKINQMDSELLLKFIEYFSDYLSVLLRTLLRFVGSRDGAVVRALPPMWPGFDSRTRRHMWVEFVVGSRLRSEGFSPGSPVFLPPQKPTFLNSNSIWNTRTPLNEFPRALWCFVGK